jgi:N-methylhydantoinase A
MASGQRIRYEVGVDIGGTFTDLILLGNDGTLYSRKVLSTPDDYGRGIVTAMQGALAVAAASPAQVERVVHATTVATNAILEHKGARTALVTTRGFRDVLEMRRLRIPEMYVLNYPKPEPLVPRHLRLEIVERIGPKGEVWDALDEASVETAAARLAAANVESVAIALLHSYANPSHERRVRDLLAGSLGDTVFITCSSDILPVIREYERTSTTVINAFLGPALRRYFASLRQHLKSIGVTAPLQVMKSDGGVMSVEAATEKPAYIVESGPAAGVIGAAGVTRLMRESECITLDMGGTTAKASIVEGGRVSRTSDYEVGAGVNLSSKLVMGGGYALKLPVVDISEIGAGGGSLISFDSGGLLRVGPKSAGSSPGPVAYDLGGEDPTFTDAALALGYINPGQLVDGALRLNAAKSRRALQARIAQPLRRDLLETAYGVFEVACGTMIRAVKAVSTYRGRDPRDFTLFAFGGNGPVVAAHLAAMMQMRHVVIPPDPGVFSAFGLLLSDLEHEMAHGFLRSLADVTAFELEAQFAELEERVAALLRQEGADPARARFIRLADLRYAGQAHELTITLADGRAEPAQLADAFGREHERTYGHKAQSEAVECVTLRVIGRIALGDRGAREGLAFRNAAGGSTATGSRPAFFGPSRGLLDTPVIRRMSLAARPRPGPLIVDEYDATAVVPPGWTASLDERTNIHLTRD